MNKIISCSIMILISVSLASCAHSNKEVRYDHYYKPMNDIQREYYDIETLFNTRKYDGVIESGNAFINKYKRDILNVAVVYYIAESYAAKRDVQQAEIWYKKILETHPDDEWGKLATVGMADLQK